MIHPALPLVQESGSITFEWYRTLPTYRAHQVTTFTIGHFVYMSLLHYHQSVSLWEFGDELGFRKVDEVPLDGARGLTHLNINGTAYVFLSASRRPLLSESRMMEIRPKGMLIMMEIRPTRRLTMNENTS